MHRKNMQEFLVLFPKPCCKSKKYSKLPFPVLAASIIKVTLSLVTSTFDLFSKNKKIDIPKLCATSGLHCRN